MIKPKLLPITIWILLCNTIISASQTWTYVDKLGHVEYCCICHKDFERTDVIHECYLKNKNDARLPFCNCYKGIFPACPKNTTICNREVTCPERRLYKECKVSHLKNNKLVCNDSLEWEPKFTCPECNKITIYCNRKIYCSETIIGSECMLPFNTSQKLICGDDQQWKTDFKCPGNNFIV
ncbi:uncharacterized protein LOC115229376 [Octopus sinensis]|uniref:Uncharacterized protein LOC115229376 n=1 Tax=Octopus sinensis TaxID=2607531 RepID=A0A6P7U067_9MOLL|nr:uncharacterized protein LOC115229376 [Octopus sinensis]